MGLAWLPGLLGKALDAIKALGPLLAAFALGASRERLKSTEKALDAAKTRITVEDEVRRLDGTAAVDELRRDWKR